MNLGDDMERLATYLTEKTGIDLSSSQVRGYWKEKSIAGDLGVGLTDIPGPKTPSSKYD